MTLDNKFILTNEWIKRNHMPSKAMTDIKMIHPKPTWFKLFFFYVPSINYKNQTQLDHAYNPPQLQQS